LPNPAPSSAVSKNTQPHPKTGKGGRGGSVANEIEVNFENRSGEIDYVS
jgi:hypothetical protein